MNFTFGKAPDVPVVLFIPSNDEENRGVYSSETLEKFHCTLGDRFGRDREFYPTTKDENGMTPLHYAARLLPAGCISQWPGYGEEWQKWNSLLKGLDQDDLNGQDEDGRTPMSHAAEIGDVGAMHKLILAGADPYQCDKNGRSPLSWAAQFGRKELIELLSWRSKFSDDKDNQGWTPCHYFLNREPESIEGYDFMILPLIWDRGHSQEVERLTGRKAFSKTSLWSRVPSNSMSSPWSRVPSDYMSTSLLSETDNFGLTLLSRAVQLDRILFVKILLTTRDIDIGVPDRDGKTPLWRAIEAGSRAISELLWDDDDITLRLLAANAQYDLVEWLVTNGYPLARRHGPHDETAFHIMLEISNISVMENLLRKALAAQEPNLPEDTVEAPTNVSQSFLKATNRRGLTPLALAKEKRLLPIVKLFLRWRAEVDPFKEKADWFSLLRDCNDKRGFRYFEKKYRGVSFELVEKKNNILVFDFYNAEDVTPQGYLVERCDMLQHLWLHNSKQNWIASLQHGLYHKCHGDEINATILITDLSDDSRYLAAIQKALQDQVKEIQNVIDEYRRVDERHLSCLGNSEKDLKSFKSIINDRLDKQHERVRDLRQMEFARLSVEETVFMRRISLITFIFLPLMFASSLFGMNVNALQSNPDWRWYIVFGAASLLLTYALWKVSDQNIRLSQIWSKIRPRRAMKNKKKDCEG
ncbi:hypothetical protein AnigIFM60653_007758 [Aspergillus niger]|nr:hypothetical protein AnigIFM60653_007758 [Aspergillus niger]